MGWTEEKGVQCRRVTSTAMDFFLSKLSRMSSIILQPGEIDQHFQGTQGLTRTQPEREYLAFSSFKICKQFTGSTLSFLLRGEGGVLVPCF